LENQDLTPEFLEECSVLFKKSDWSIAAINQPLTVDFIKQSLENGKIFLSDILKNKKINIDQIKDMVDEDVVKSMIKKSLKVPADILEKHAEEGKFNHSDWLRISAGQQLSERFMNKYRDQLNWKILSKEQRFTSSGIRKYDLPIDVETFKQFNTKTQMTPYIINLIRQTDATS
jgi:hypothetical protein